MNQGKLKILLPTLREKTRYIKFQIISEEPVNYSDLESGVWGTLLDFFGELGISETNAWLVKNLYDERNQIGVIRCDNKSVTKVISGLGLISRLGDTRVIFKILKVSGTIRALKLPSKYSSEKSL